MSRKKLLPALALITLSLGLHPYSLAQQSSVPGLQKRLGDLLSSPKEDELLEPAQAFRMQLKFKGPATLVADLIPAPGYYLYRDRIRFAIRNGNGIAIKAVKLPPGEIKNDLSFGKVETYRQPVQAEILLDRAPGAKNFTLAASYQGCHEKTGVCYPPVDTAVNLSAP
ncbi:protein-disulfide reductase DsbD N-terminal domain-containing protein [Noviherbaspirillum massiliense]|uniref:protein-disulfide reductase DsbD N-terminal domain-containing protein n=1 Tax=Noviherbaspirillum massiliense TaxID=1465823 RepID=UPI0009D9FF93|nr:protein-disulfide reductase DsbD N-terminal domain-containing protein [Noviherbaspirillum massiliense]